MDRIVIIGKVSEVYFVILSLFTIIAVCKKTNSKQKNQTSFNPRIQPIIKLKTLIIN